MRTGRPIKSLVGCKFGKLTVIKLFDKHNRYGAIWNCQCDCGNIINVLSGHLQSKQTQSCGCLRYHDLTDKKFGRLTPICAVKTDKHGNKIWKAKCDCGNVVQVNSNSLHSGHVQSCGCLASETSIINGQSNVTHALSQTRFYEIWRKMKVRCINLQSPNYIYYGGRGIIVCDRWLKFENFRDDMYESYLRHVEEFGEKNTSIDRFPNQKGNYEPSNCRWATNKEQARNKRNSSLSLDYDKHIYWKVLLQNLLNQSVKRATGKKFERFIGCAISEFKVYIESEFKKGMTWNNHGRGAGTWQFDHIVGINNFDLSKEAERLKCFHFTNLRPMWDEEHKNKSRLRDKS